MPEARRLFFIFYDIIRSMKEVGGFIIVIISIFMITIMFYYNHFHMVSFARGLPEATFDQRMIATLIDGLPFIGFIYIAFRLFIFGSDDEKLPSVKSRWSLSAIFLAFLGFAVSWPIIAGILMGSYVRATHGTEVACNKMIGDAHNTAAALADYYANPDRISVPSAEQLMEEGYLSTNFTVTIEADANGEPVITVINEKEKCPRGQKYIYYMNGMETEWKD